MCAPLTTFVAIRMHLSRGMRNLVCPWKDRMTLRPNSGLDLNSRGIGLDTNLLFLPPSFPRRCRVLAPTG